MDVNHEAPARKRVVIICNNARVSSTIAGNLRTVFEDKVDIIIRRPSDIEQADHIDADAFLVTRWNLIGNLENKVSDKQRIVRVTRTITTEALQKILTIPTNSTVLLVNDSERSTYSLRSLLLDLHLDDFNYVVYDPKQRDPSATVAITPDEMAYVPTYVEKVINIGQRVLDIKTVFNICTLLGFSLSDISSGMMRYINSIVDPNNSDKPYRDILLLNERMQNVLRYMEQGLLLTQDDGIILIANEKIESLLGHRIQDGQDNLADIFPDEVASELLAMDRDNRSFHIFNREFTVQHEAVMFSTSIRQNLYFFSDITYLHSLEQNIAARSQGTGFVVKYTFDDIIYHSKVMRDCVDQLKIFASSDKVILILGETGTGKELLAHSIHNASPRRHCPFVAINCAALPASLLESELFGYEGGAFTGAKRTGRAGLFEQADGGTLFLDEIGDMPVSLQSRLLRVLQEMQIMRVGGSRVININVRIIAATNQNLEQKIRDGSFRGDLYYRLNVLPCQVPPLRNRREDIIPLFLHFAGMPKIPADIARRLEAYDWPGNVRELQNAAGYYVMMRKSGHALPGYIADAVPASAEEDTRALEQQLLILLGRHSCGRSALVRELAGQGFAVSEYSLRRCLEDMERRGLILRGVGRGGTRLSGKGLEALEKVCERL